MCFPHVCACERESLSAQAVSSHAVTCPHGRTSKTKSQIGISANLQIMQFGVCWVCFFSGGCPENLADGPQRRAKKNRLLMCTDCSRTLAASQSGRADRMRLSPKPAPQILLFLYFYLLHLTCDLRMIPVTAGTLRQSGLTPLISVISSV